MGLRSLKKLQDERTASKNELKKINRKLDTLDRRVNVLEQTVQVYKREV